MYRYIDIDIDTETRVSSCPGLISVAWVNENLKFCFIVIKKILNLIFFGIVEYHF